VGVGLVASTLAGLSAYTEARQRRAAMTRLFEGQAAILTEVLAGAVVHSARAFDEIENVTVKRLTNLLDVLNQWDRTTPLTDERLRSLLPTEEFFRIYVFDKYANVVASNRRRPGAGSPFGAGEGFRWGQRQQNAERLMRNRGDTAPPSATETPWPPPLNPPDLTLRFEPRPPRLPPILEAAKPYLDEVLSRKSEQVVLGFRLPHGRRLGDIFGVIRQRSRGGALVAMIETDAMTQLKSVAGRDALLSRVGEARGILNVSWVVLAESPADPGFRWEWGRAQDREAFVGVRTVVDEDGKPAEIRVSLDASPFVETTRTARVQGVVRVGLVALATLAVTGFLFLRQNNRLLRNETARIRDEVRRLEEERRRREKLTAMGELAAGVAHEIRNPLNAIGMVAQRLAREFDPTENADEYQELLDILRNESARVESVVEQFLRFARPPKMNRLPGDLASTVRDTARRLRAYAETQGVQLELDASDTLPFRFDANQIGQVLENLIRNAVEANGKRVCVTLAPVSEGVLLRVTDDGAGIPPETLARVFDLYYTTKPNGTGLGLAVVQQIVAEHGGEIHIKSEVGQGTTVEILFTIGVGDVAP
jgi:signal transduction histidine kinase